MKNLKTRVVCAITVALGLLAVSPASVRAQVPTALPLVQPGNMRYLGSFPVAASDGSGTDQGLLTYGGAALAVNPATQTLFIGGHDWYSRLCEVRIPTAGGQQAAAVQRCTDVSEGRLTQIDVENGVKLGGTLVWNGRLIVSAYSFYDADSSARLSHFLSSTDLARTGDVQGPFQVGHTGGGYVGGYMGVIPEEWRAAFGGPALTGQCCLSIIGRTSAGPSASVFNPDDVGRVSPVPAAPVLGYPIASPLAPYSAQNELFNGATEIVGVAFPAGTRSVLFIGRQGIGRYCYGEGAACGDPVSEYKGTHAYPYVHQVWAYDAVDLAMVRHGLKLPWTVRPYATWRLSDMNASGGATVAGATYDHTTGRLFVTEEYGSRPRVHVYQIGEATGPSGPAAQPQNFRVSVSGSSVTFTWSPPALGELVTGYLLDAGTAPNASNLLSGAPLGAGFVLTIPNVPAGTYHVRIRARNVFGVSAPSAEVAFTVGSVTAPPGAPTLSASVSANRVLMLSWSPPRSGGAPTSYILEAGTAPGLNQLSGDVGSITSLAVPGLPPGEYYLRARARNAAGTGPPSADVRVVVR